MAVVRVVAVSGPVGSGKSTLARGLAETLNFTRLSTHKLLVARLGTDPGRAKLQAAGESLDKKTRGAWVAEEVMKLSLASNLDIGVVLDSVRISAQLEHLRNAFTTRLTHVHLTAPIAELGDRYGKRAAERPGELASYAAVRRNPTEAQVEGLASEADVWIDTGRDTPGDVLARALARFAPLNLRGRGAVDVLVGGQYGSEGKGNVAAYLAPEYGLLVRVGGPNAGHQVSLPDGAAFVHRLLPSGTQFNGNARIHIGPGAVLDVAVLADEIAQCGVTAERLSIDPRAMIISDADIKSEMELVKKIGSTGKGVGAATARRIQGRLADRVALAEVVEVLKPYIKPSLAVYDDAVSRGERILLEGTQGTGLSLYHGDYPHVTSRDTTASACLSEAGFAPLHVRRVVMLVRTYPIRVESPKGKTSGPMSEEISWKEIARRSGHKASDLKRVEKGSVSGKQRRVGEFDWVQLRRSAFLNGCSDVALTFADYLKKANERARRFEQLDEATVRFVEEVERVAGAPVSLIATRFHYRSIIDRRLWT